MGLDLFLALGFFLVDTKGDAILTVSAPWQQKWPSLFDGLGGLTAFSHQPLLNPSVKPVIQPLRRIPLALHDSVSAELQLLLAAGIIEQVDMRRPGCQTWWLKRSLGLYGSASTSTR